MKKVYIIASKRTPLGSFGGVLSPLSAVDLGITAAKGAIVQAGIDPKSINEAFFGNVCQANLGQAPARQVALGAGVNQNAPATTINKVCASGMKSIIFGAQAIQLGISDCILAGGMESMSNIPHYMPSLRWGKKFGASEIIDGLQKDGLSDAYDQGAMGVFADSTAVKYEISREEQDRFAIQSYKRAQDATANKIFNDEIVPVAVPQRRKDDLIVSEDEEISKVDFERVAKLRPAFTKEGSATAANSSTINDGASAIILASEDYVKAHGIKPLAEIISYADAAQEPEWFTTSPTLAAPKAISNAKMNINDIGLFEVNEAFAVVTLAFNQKLKISEEKVNVLGGAVSMGHPLGASGSRIVNTLITGLKHKNKEIGCATLCNGGGGASALVIKMM